MAFIPLSTTTYLKHNTLQNVKQLKSKTLVQTQYNSKGAWLEIKQSFLPFACYIIFMSIQFFRLVFSQVLMYRNARHKISTQEKTSYMLPNTILHVTAFSVIAIFKKKITAHVTMKLNIICNLNCSTNKKN